MKAQVSPVQSEGGLAAIQWVAVSGAGSCAGRGAGGFVVLTRLNDTDVPMLASIPVDDWT